MRQRQRLHTTAFESRALLAPEPPGFRRRSLFGGVLAAALVSGLLAVGSLVAHRGDSPPPAPSDACSIFCGDSPLLRAVQSRRLFADSKSFVDMPMRVSPGDVAAAFAEAFPLGAEGARDDELRAFVARFFLAAGSDTEMVSEPSAPFTLS